MYKVILKKCQHEIDIKTIFKLQNKIGPILQPIKDKIPHDISRVNHIKHNCGQCYIGETGIQFENLRQLNLKNMYKA